LLKRWLREPLLHFLLIGAALFALYGLQNDEVKDDSRRIVISESDVDRLISLWEKKWQRLPTQAELEGLIEAQIREEVLYREALAMGLDQNDTIVRRRLAQKVEFISADLAAQVEPTEMDLQTYLDSHIDKFTIPGRISFQQVYLNPDKRGELVEADARQLLSDLRKPGTVANIMAIGDSFMFGQQYKDLSEHGVARQFGKEFAAKLFTLPVGNWQGPVLSGYGLHLVLVESKVASRQPALAEVRDRVRDEWLTDQRRDINEAFYAELRKRYEISVDMSADKTVNVAQPDNR
jgi:peptidyl-prolyl cis-trans isomerase C